jgi:neopullulanase
LQGDQFDAVMNYPVTKACLGYFAGDNLLREEAAKCGYHWIDPLDDQAFAAEIKRILGLYPRPTTEVQLNLLGSHDTPRFKTLARGDDSAYRLALLFQMTYPGAPCIYYGDEIGLEGGHEPASRNAFPWDERKWERELHGYVQRCITLRKDHAALRRGDLTWLFAGQGVVVYGRRLDGKVTLVLLNSSQRPVTLGVPVSGYLDDGTMLRDLWDGTVVSVIGGRAEEVCVPTRSGMVLEAIGVPG